jgi:hypothetical protein
VARQAQRDPAGVIEPANPLEEALLAASRGGDAGEFLDALRDHEVLVPYEDPPAEERPLEEGDEVALPLIEREGARYVPVFTSPEQMAIGAPNIPRALRLTGLSLARVWPAGVGMAINPGAELGVALPEDTVRGLLGGVDERIPAGTTLKIGAPTHEPETAWQALRAWAAGRPEVLAAHRAVVIAEGPDERAHLMVGLELAPGADVEALCRAAAEAVGGGIGVTPVERDGDPISDWMLEHDEPVYRR